MKWARNTQTSVFGCTLFNRGRICSLEEALLKSVYKKHDYVIYNNGEKLEGEIVDAETIDYLRTTDLPEWKERLYKLTMQCLTPSGCFVNKSKDPAKRVMLHPNPILQLDFDHLKDYDIDEVKQAIYSLPFIGCVGLSCRGKGLFALALIEEPERLTEYAEHCFRVFESYGIPVDTTKGRNHSDLRFVTVDRKMLFREDPTPLKIKRFNTPKIVHNATPRKIYTSHSIPIKWAVEAIQNAQVGQRFEAVRKAAYTLGGHGAGLDEIKQAIIESSQYHGVTNKYLNHADECFAAGKLKPLKQAI